MQNILLVSDSDSDFIFLNRILKSHGFSIIQTPFDDSIDQKILNNGYPLILADYELVRDRAHLFYEIQKGSSKACLIFYGGGIEAEEVNRILQNGVYTIIHRPFLAERVHDAIVGGLENRKAFLEILGMMNELKVVNESLEKERNALRKKNQELGFINLLSSEISYDLTWDRILTRMINSGLPDTLDYSLFGIFFKIGADWNLTLHMTEGSVIKDEESFKSEILSHISTQKKEKIPAEEIKLQIVSPEREGDSSLYRLERCEVLPLTLAGKNLGSLFYIPKGVDRENGHGKELIDTLANILSISLKNAQEYHKLKEASVTDSLTGIYNRKGLHEFLIREFHRSRRYGKDLALVMIDMDNFKGINDSLGHQAGDYVLRELGAVMKGSVRRPDIVARYGGDEFVILLPEATNSEAEMIMERVTHNTKDHTFEWGSGKIRTRMSFGVSNISELEEGHTEEDLIKLADSRLYAVKNP